MYAVFRISLVQTTLIYSSQVSSMDVRGAFDKHGLDFELLEYNTGPEVFAALANGAIVAGIALGSLSMKTRSIYQGFLVHITVAGLMDWLALWHRHALPTVFTAPG